jgi:hypothetical protein
MRRLPCSADASSCGPGGLQDEHGGGRVDALLLLTLDASLQAERADGALRHDGREAFVCESHAKARPLGELVTERADLARPVALVAGEGERQPDDDVDDAVLCARSAMACTGGRLPALRVSTVSGCAMVAVGSLSATPTRRSP